METETRQHEPGENGIDVPLDRIPPDTLRTMVEEFVTREWSDLSDGGYTLDEKVDQVIRQLKEKRAKVVFDLGTQTCNIVPCR